MSRHIGVFVGAAIALSPAFIAHAEECQKPVVEARFLTEVITQEKAALDSALPLKDAADTQKILFRSVVRLLVLYSTYEQKTGDISDRHLQTLCALQRDWNLYPAEKDPLASGANAFLARSKDSLSKAINERQKLYGGVGCAIGNTDQSPRSENGS